MSAKPLNDQGHCEDHGDHIGGECPVCKGIRRSGARPYEPRHAEHVEHELRRRPKSGPIEE